VIKALGAILGMITASILGITGASMFSEWGRTQRTALQTTGAPIADPLSSLVNGIFGGGSGGILPMMLIMLLMNRNKTSSNNEPDVNVTIIEDDDD
jgi:uncharacterized membrane protein YfcA